MNPDRRVYEAAHRMKSPEMAPFAEWMRAELTAALEKLTYAPPGHTQTLQGRAQQLKELLDLVDNAQASLDKLEGRRPI